jgi:N-acetylneuraminic acid mutarotase
MSTGASGGSAGAPAAWSLLAPLPAGPRQECAVVTVDGKVYVIGGFDKGAEVVPTVEAYDPESDSWASVAPLPAPLHHANAASVGGKIYVLGSLKGELFSASGESYVYDPAKDSWSNVASLPAGRERGGAGVAVIGSHVYVAGGYRAGSVADVDRYDTSKDVWESLPPLPEARDHLVGAAVQGAFFAIGGRNGGIEELRGQVDRFDPGKGTWASGAPMLTPRGGAAAGVIDDRIYVVGGEGNVNADTGVFEENEAYDPAKDAWSSGPPMKPPKHGTGGAVVGGKLYVPGGATVQAFGATDDVQVFVP